MKSLKIDTKKNIIRALVNSYDDLIVLQYIVEKGDRLVAYSKRKMEVAGEQVVKVVKIGIEVEDVEPAEKALRISGRIFYSSDKDIPLHKYHTLELKLKSAFNLGKQKIMTFQINMLRKAQERSPKVFVCVYEPGYGILYQITNYSVRRLYEVKHSVQGKRFKNESREAFIEKLGTALAEEYAKRKWNVFIVAGTTIDNEDLRKGLLKGMSVTYETVSYADTGLKELISKDKINEMISRTKVATQRNLINEYIGEISKGNEKYVYGKKGMEDTLHDSRVIQAIVTKDYVFKNKDVINSLDSNGVDIIFFDERDESLEQLQNFGGIIVKLR